MMKLFVALMVYTSASFACISGKGFLPENDMYLDVDYKSINGGIDEQEFNRVLDKLQQVYDPIINQYGGNLKINRLWSDGTVNASANRQGSDYIINMYGGLARHQVVTSDAFALVACHEVGHHIGGVPRYTQRGGEWASVEGQSDYFATTKCLRKLFMNDDNSTIVRELQVPSEVVSKCENQFSAQNDQDICQRIAMAGLSAASLFANGNPPRFNTPDTNRVSQTFESHPQPQCRLDTYYNGGVCGVEEDVEIGQQNPNIGTCNRANNDSEGLRPLCWFKPAGSNPNPNPNPPGGDTAATPTVNGQTSIQTQNPNQLIPIALNLSGHQGAQGFAIEVSKPNQGFSNPNGREPDRRNGLWLQSFRGTSGTYRLLPSRQLPGWGVYQVRIIALDGQARPVSNFSNPLIIRLGR
ncbi:MAG: hypothetical protein CME65_12880 [Halobacteriovoraceae bacterium]|nr:hypothetical protein [Halobacteriovoraceae bacterium]